jgi:hypothetical protein
VDVRAAQLNELTFSAIALGAVALGFSPLAGATPSGIGSALDTVNELRDNGFEVVLNKMGPGPLDHCTVDSVRPGETVTRPAQSGGALGTQIVYQTVYLTARC